MIGKIIFVNKQTGTVYMLQIGPEGKVLEFSLERLEITDEIDRQYPARLHEIENEKCVQYVVDEDGVVTSAQVLDLRNGFRSYQCNNKHSGIGGNVVNGAHQCACGNITWAQYRHCNVCALVKGECVLCGNPV